LQLYNYGPKLKLQTLAQKLINFKQAAWSTSRALAASGESTVFNAVS